VEPGDGQVQLLTPAWSGSVANSARLTQRFVTPSAHTASKVAKSRGFAVA